MSTVSVIVADTRKPRDSAAGAEQFLRKSIADLEKKLDQAHREHIVPLMNELEPLRRALSAIQGTTYEGLGTLAAARKLLAHRGSPLTKEEIAAELLKAGFVIPVKAGREARELKRSPMAPEQKIVRAIARYAFEGDLVSDKDGKISLPEWKKK